MSAGDALGRYRIVRELGRGGMGVVYEAEEPQLGRRVALKLLAPGALDHELLLRFSREAAALARVSHPNVLRVHALEPTPRGPCLVTELVAGEPLDARLARGPLAPAAAGALVRTLADAVAAVHAAGLLHRDLKPSNVLVREDGSPVLLDFGLARELDAQTLTRTGTLLGTPAYMAPEQALGAPTRELTPRVDVYALGAVLLACLTGRDPFRGVGTYAVVRQVIEEEPAWPAAAPPELVAVGQRAMAKHPEERFAGASELARALDEALASAPLTEPGARRAHGPLAAALALAALAALGVLALSGGEGAPGPATSAAPSGPGPAPAGSAPAADARPLAPAPRAPRAPSADLVTHARLELLRELALPEGRAQGYVVLGEHHVLAAGPDHVRAWPLAGDEPPPWVVSSPDYHERPNLAPDGALLLLTGPPGVAQVRLAEPALEPFALTPGVTSAKCLAFDDEGGLAVGVERGLVARRAGGPEQRVELEGDPREVESVGDWWVAITHRKGGAGSVVYALDRETLERRGEVELRMRAYGVCPAGSDGFWIGTSKGQLLRYALGPSGIERVGHLAPEGAKVRYEDDLVGMPVPRAHDRPVLGVALVRGGRALVALVADYWREPYGGELAVWSLDTGALIASEPYPDGPVPTQFAVREREDGRVLIAVITHGLWVTLWEATLE